MVEKVTIAHSPDADDAFMFYALVSGKVKTPFKVEHVLLDIESLNKHAFEAKYDVSAVSFHVYPYIADKYKLLRCGGSVGYNYGPIVVAREDIGSLRGKKIAVPGRYTTAFLILKLYEYNFDPIFISFDKILDYVKEGNADAGLIIHEGQLTYKEYGLKKIVDLGEWWFEKYSLPLPLGCLVARRDLKHRINEDVEKYIKKSIEYALKNKEEALEYALNYARGLSRDRAERFVEMYVNNSTLEYSEEDIKAIKILLNEGYKKGIISVEPRVDI